MLVKCKDKRQFNSLVKGLKAKGYTDKTKYSDGLVLEVCGSNIYRTDSLCGTRSSSVETLKKFKPISMVGPWIINPNSKTTGTVTGSTITLAEAKSIFKKYNEGKIGTLFTSFNVNYTSKKEFDLLIATGKFFGFTVCTQYVEGNNSLIFRQSQSVTIGSFRKDFLGVKDIGQIYERLSHTNDELGYVGGYTYYLNTNGDLCIGCQTIPKDMISKFGAALAAL